MPNIQAKDATGATIYLKSSKANTDLDPAISQEDLEATLEAISAKLPTLASGRVSVDGSGVTQPISGTVDILLVPGVARQLAATSTSDNTTLTSTCRKISILATGGDIRYSIGSASQTASTTSHFIAAGERLDLGVPATPNIAVIRAASINATLEVTEFL